MLESLGRIKSPFVRSVTAAATVCSVVTLTTAVALGVAKAKDESAYRFGVYSDQKTKGITTALVMWMRL